MKYLSLKLFFALYFLYNIDHFLRELPIHFKAKTLTAKPFIFVI